MKPFWLAFAFLLLAGTGFRLLQADIPWTGGNAADWFQAVGSVAAIFAVIGVSWYEGRRDERKANRDLQQYRITVAALAARMADLIEREAGDMLRNPEFYFRDGGLEGPFKQLAEVLGRFDPTRLESATGALCMHDIQRLGAAAGSYMRSVARDYESDSSISPDLLNGLHDWPIAARRAANVLAHLSGDAEQVRAIAGRSSRES